MNQGEVTVLEEAENCSWYWNFMVGDVLVKTLDVYTYGCTKCKTLQCGHTDAVHLFVAREMENTARSQHPGLTCDVK